MTAYLAANVERFSGSHYVDTYDKHRPQPPAILIDLLTQLGQIKRPRLVVDLGAGTGLSTRIWVDRADVVIGIEPNADMRRIAEAQTAAMPNARHIRYKDGFSHQTGLVDECADIVMCSQSLHWMEPGSTFAEVARILRPDGVFAAVDCDWPPAVNWQAQVAYNVFMDQAEAIGRSRNWYAGVQRWRKQEHLERMRASGKFRFLQEVMLHSVEPGDAERLVQIALSQAGVATLFRRGLSQDQVGVPKFREAVQLAMGEQTMDFYFSYRLKYGIK